MGTKTPKETDLSVPVVRYLTEQGYIVRSEVHHCDIAAVRGDELIVIELKRSLNLKLIVQATERQRMTDSVYVAVPRPKQGLRSREWKGILHVLRRLELGLLFVSIDSPVQSVQVVEHPRPFVQKRKPTQRLSIIREVVSRSADYNVAGSTRTPLMTAYKEQAVFIAVCLDRYGPLSPQSLSLLGTTQKTGLILRANYYDWFSRVSRGVYTLTEAGRSALSLYPDLTEHYRRQLDTSDTRRE